MIIRLYKKYKGANMSVLLKMCPQCKGDLLSYVDMDDFKVYKCAQCSRTYNPDLFEGNNIENEQLHAV